MNGEHVKDQLRQALDDLQASARLKPGQLFVIGCSTSEVTGKRIGTAGTTDVAEELYEEFTRFKEKTGVRLAFQGCEHINRALLLERESAESRGYDLVSVIPAAKAGGAMAAYAYSRMTDPVVVEFIRADAGIDIGDTLIGMHLKHVAVPVRSTVTSIGDAHLTMAKTRPKLIGGERAVYKPHQNSCFGK